MGIEERENIQTKSIDNSFSIMIAENFPSLGKGRDKQVEESYQMPNHQDQKRNTPDISLS
jgi:hypothetical protein